MMMSLSDEDEDGWKVAEAAFKDFLHDNIYWEDPNEVFIPKYYASRQQNLPQS